MKNLFLFVVIIVLVVAGVVAFQNRPQQSSQAPEGFLPDGTPLAPAPPPPAGGAVVPADTPPLEPAPPPAGVGVTPTEATPPLEPTPPPGAESTAPLAPALPPSVEPDASSEPLSAQTPAPPPTVLSVSYTDAGYAPTTITVKKGELVSFVNGSSQSMWTATAVHPTHCVYPGSDIAKCGSTDAIGMFDSCLGTPAGGAWAFQFDESGTWKYHNHLNPAHIGTVVVE